MKKLISVIMSVAIFLSLCGCFGGKETASLNVYLKNAQTKELEAVNIKYSGSQTTVDMATFAVNNLIQKPENQKYETPIPDNTSLLSLSVKDETANVDFSAEFTNYTGIDELLARFSIVRTLCDIPGITKVSITVNSLPLISNATGNEVGVLSKKDVVFDVSIVNPGTETTTVTLYFATGDNLKLKPENRKIETQDTISIEKAIVNELIKGPSSPELNAVIPQGTKLLNIETKDGVCYVNLSQDFVSKFAGGTGILPVYCIVNSLSGLESVRTVQILIEGEKGAEFGNFVFDEPIEPNFEFLQD